MLEVGITVVHFWPCFVCFVCFLGRILGDFCSFLCILLGGLFAFPSPLFSVCLFFGGAVIICTPPSPYGREGIPVSRSILFTCQSLSDDLDYTMAFLVDLSGARSPFSLSLMGYSYIGGDW